MKAIMTVTRTVGKNTGSVSPSADNTKGKKTASELGPQALAGSTQQPVSFERHPPKENTSHHVPRPSQPPPLVLMLFSFSGSSSVGSHTPTVVISYLQSEGVWCLIPLPP